MRVSLLLILLLLSSHKESLAQNLEWANSLEGASTCIGVVVDDDHNVYITGVCNGLVDFDPGSGSHFISAGQNGIFIAKYGPGGSLIWVNVLISDGGNKPMEIILDNSGNVLIIGSVMADVDFDPGTDTALVQVPSGIANLMVIAKYDSDGNFIWVKSVGAAFATWGNDIAVDQFDHIYATGSFYDSLDIDPGPLEYNLISNGSSNFFSKYNEDGDLIWAKNIEGIGNLGGASDIDVSTDGNIFLAGYFGNTVDFDTGTGDYILSAETTADRYFAKYDNNGDFIWARNINVNDDGGLVVGRSFKIAVDADENVFLTGDFKSNADFDAGPDFYTMTSTSGYSTFILSYNSTGNFSWAKMIAGGYCVANDIELDCVGNINLTGVFSQADFDPGTETYLMTSSAPSAGMNFFASYDPSGDFLWARKIGNNGYGSGIIRSEMYVKDDSQFIVGAFKQSGDFNPDDDAEEWLTTTGVGANAFFAKYTGNLAYLGNDTSLCEIGSLELSTPNGEGIFLWSDNSTNPKLIVNEPGTYWVTVTNGECTATDSILISLHECGDSYVAMPNVFTPDQDGINDTFLPVELNNIRSYHLIIVNRWGGLMFESKDPANGWDGYFNGKECAEGVYFWNLSYIDHLNSENQMHGFLTLVR